MSCLRPPLRMTLMLRSDWHLNTYYWLVSPLRRLLLTYLRQRHRSPVTGVFLHRVADDRLNPWSITTTQFKTMLDWLQANVDLVSIEEAQHRIAEGNRGRIAVHISFDDGYADNCLYAIPELIRRSIPFTYFVTTGNIQDGKPFRHDVEFGHPLAPNSIDEIQAMADAGIEIGAHTRNHTSLGPGASRRQIEFEVWGSRDDIADWTGRQPRYFAFPFGQPEDISAHAIQFVHDSGFRGYSSAHGGFQGPLRDSAFHLKRFHGDPRFARLRNWISGDPRWVCRSPEFEYLPLDIKQPDALRRIFLSSR